MLYQINNGTKYFGVNDVFENINFEVNEREKIALIGRNGSGKSTILKIMMASEELSSGNIYRPNNLRIGYLSQSTFNDDNQLLKEAMDEAFKDIINIKNKLDDILTQMETDTSEAKLDEYTKVNSEFELMGGYNYQNELEMLLTKFGFKTSDLERMISTFSGGQKTRLAFVRLLVSKPDILLLDEPTNHLDLKTIEWLEGYLKRYPKAIVLVSHDRIFLDNIADTVYDLEYGMLKKYRGNYSSFEEQKVNDQAKNHDAFARQQKEIQRLETLIEKFRYKATKASFAQSKIKQLARMDKIEDANKSDNKSFKAHFSSRIKGGKHILEMADLKIGYDKVLCDINLDIYHGNRVCVLGDNGTGKSTLLKTLVGELKPLGGNYLYGHQIEVGYFDQNLIEFNGNKTVLEEVWDEYPDLDQTAIRSILGNFLFSADDVFKSVRVLSGGEKVRLALVKLVLQRPNFLVLDEPTNHLDIVGKQALEKALKDYDGTILMVSHDRYFIKKIATSCLLLDNGGAEFYPYGYKEYIDSKAKADKQLEQSIEKNYKPKSNKTRVRNLEIKISELEATMAEKKKLLFDEDYYSDHQKLRGLEKEITDLQMTLDELLEEWTTLQ